SGFFPGADAAPLELCVRDVLDCPCGYASSSSPMAPWSFHVVMTEIKVFSTCPDSRAMRADAYPGRVAEVARWSEGAGCEVILVYTDNAIVDAWLVSQLIVSATVRICPLVAVQPAYMHPYSAAKMIASF